MLGWEVAHGRDWDTATRRDGYGPLVMRLPAPADQSDVADLAARHGLRAERYFFEMSRQLRTPFAATDIPGVQLIDWDDTRSAEVHAVINEAFRDHWGHTDTTAQMWAEHTGSQAFRPSWSVLARDEGTDRIVGAALNCAWEQDWDVQGYTEGYTDQLGVLRTHRGRGIASALLIESMRRFADAGMEAAGLGVDSANPSGALRLYTSLGYHPTARTCIHQLTVTADDDHERGINPQ